MRANERRQPLRSVPAVCCILMVCATTLSACSGNLGPRTHEELTPLDLPNIQRLTEYSKLAPSTSSELIDSLITYVEPDHQHPQAVTAIDGKMYVSNLDGANGRRLDTSYPCYAGAVSPDGKWFACPNETDLSFTHDELQVTSLKPGEWFPTHIAHLGFEGDASSPAWSPDGHLLAIVHDESFTDNGGCAISIFSSSSHYRGFTHVAEISTREFDNFLVCPIDSLRWSPDGEWLAVDTRGVILIPIRDVLRDVTSGSDSPASIFVPDSALVSLTEPQDDRTFAPAWDPESHLVSYLTVPHFDSERHVWDPQRIMSYDPASQQRIVLLTLPLTDPDPSFEYIQHMSALAWSPDGQQLIFVLDKYVNCIDCSLTYPSQVYTFTPTPISA